jgi:hypothetical protein
MSTIGDIAGALKTNLDAIDGINVSRYPRSNPVPPIIHMWPSEPFTYHRAIQMGLSELVFTVQLVYSYTDDQATAANVYAFLDPSGARSVRAAVESDRTLGGLVETLQCESNSGLAVSLTPENQPRLTSDGRLESI